MHVGAKLFSLLILPPKEFIKSTTDMFSSKPAELKRWSTGLNSLQTDDCYDFECQEVVETYFSEREGMIVVSPSTTNSTD